MRFKWLGKISGSMRSILWWVGLDSEVSRWKCWRWRWCCWQGHQSAPHRDGRYELQEKCLHHRRHKQVCSLKCLKYCTHFSPLPLHSSLSVSLSWRIMRWGPQIVHRSMVMEIVRVVIFQLFDYLRICLKFLLYQWTETFNTIMKTLSRVPRIVIKFWAWKMQNSINTITLYIIYI